MTAPKRRRRGTAVAPPGPGPGAGRPEELPRGAADPARLDALLASLSVERLQAFVRPQAAESPGLIDDLRIFAQGGVEADDSGGSYADDIAAALAQVKASRLPPEWYESFYEGDDDDGGIYDEVKDLLEPFRDDAREYLAKGDRIESGKIYEALLHACGRAMNETRDGDHGDYFADAALDQAVRALDEWAELIGQAPDGPDRPRLIEPFVAAYASDVSALGAQAWQGAFRAAVRDGLSAEMALCCMDAIELDDSDPDRAGVLFHLLDLSGDNDRFLRVARQAVSRRPAVAPPLVHKLIELGRRDEAVEVAENALRRLCDGSRPGRCVDTGGFASGDFRDSREALLRFLVDTCDPQRERDRLLEHARTLLLIYNDPHDYPRVRNLLSAESEIDDLLRQVTQRCSPETVTEVLGAERRWDDLLAYARSHEKEERAFQRMIRRLSDHRPVACFDLCRQAANRLLEQGTGERLYRGVAEYARLMRDIPGQDDRFGEYMAWMTETYRRRPSLIRILGDLALIGQDWRERRGRQPSLVREDAAKMDLNEIVRRCPVHFELKGPIARAGQRSAAALVWAILVRSGGTMDAAAITEAIARHRRLPSASAAAVRSSGLRLLEVLACVSIDREGHRLRRVRLIDRGDGDAI